MSDYNFVDKKPTISIQDIKNRLEEEKNKIYLRPYEDIYNDYCAFIERDLVNLINVLISEHKFTLNGKFITFSTRGSLYEGIRLELLKNFFKENGLGEIECYDLRDENLSIKYPLISSFKITFCSKATLDNLIEACSKELPSIDELKNSLKSNPVERIKEELATQKKNYSNNSLIFELTSEIKKIFPNVVISEFIPSKMYYLVVREFKTKNYFKDEIDPLYSALSELFLMGFNKMNISMLTNLSVSEIDKIVKDDKTLTRKQK